MDQTYEDYWISCGLLSSQSSAGVTISSTVLLILMEKFLYCALCEIQLLSESQFSALDIDLGYSAVAVSIPFISAPHVALNVASAKTIGSLLCSKQPKVPDTSVCALPHTSPYPCRVPSNYDYANQ